MLCKQNFEPELKWKAWKLPILAAYFCLFSGFYESEIFAIIKLKTCSRDAEETGMEAGTYAAHVETT